MQLLQNQCLEKKVNYNLIYAMPSALNFPLYISCI